MDLQVNRVLEIDGSAPLRVPRVGAPADAADGFVEVQARCLPCSSPELACAAVSGLKPTSHPTPVRGAIAWSRKERTTTEA